VYKLIIKTEKDKEVIDITEKVNDFLKNERIGEGVVNLFLTHTTAALTTADLDPGGTELDYLEAFEKIIPKLNYRHPHNPSHMPDHILASLIGSSLSLPFLDNKLVLGIWQRVVLFEFDGPKKREIIISLINSSN